jgi:uncharacterized DUF497 family protein
MWWDNDDWAARHISKHKVTVNEAWEVVFENRSVFPLVAPDQLRFPPFRRYWTINLTKKGRRLLVVWEQHRAIKNLITAFEPSEERVNVYERQIKKRR